MQDPSIDKLADLAAVMGNFCIEMESSFWTCKPGREIA
jgi:hypothetical protein